MLSSWMEPELRPKINAICSDLADVLQQNNVSSSGGNEIPGPDFDKRWAKMKPNNPIITIEDETSRIDSRTDLNALNLHTTAEFTDDKRFSASLNNLHGSLDNLLDSRQSDPMESWLENVASHTKDLSYVRGLSEAIRDLDDALMAENDLDHKQNR